MSIQLTPLDDCCFKVSSGDEYIGVWCPVSGVLSVNGEFAGLAKTKEDLIARLKKVEVTVWCIEDEKPI